jgi:TatD DNase family protein
VESAHGVLALAETDLRLFAAIGMHPNSAKTWDDDSLSQLRELATHPKVVAIGEIGLDYYWDFAPKEVQHPVLKTQLTFAAEVQLPVVIHNRDATEDVIEILLAWQMGLEQAGNPLAQRPGVLHSFSGDAEAAERAVVANFYIGITGPVTFKNAPDLQTLVSDLPLSHILIETDAPYLAPHPYRGKRNEPAYVKGVAEKIAELKSISFEEVAQKTTENAARLFRW